MAWVRLWYPFFSEGSWMRAAATRVFVLPIKKRGWGTQKRARPGPGRGIATRIHWEFIHPC
jgi:hypothetical protein